MQIQSNKTWRWLALALALFAALPAFAAESSSRELSFFSKVFSSEYNSREISLWTGQSAPEFTSREISVWSGSASTEFASREISFYIGMPKEFASREVSLNMFGTLDLANGFIGNELVQIPSGENYWMSLAPAIPGVGNDPGAVYFTVASSLWGDPEDVADDFLYKARHAAPLEQLATFEPSNFDPIGLGFTDVPGFGDYLYIASAHFGADEGAETGGGLLRHDLGTGTTAVIFDDTLLVKAPQRFDIAAAQGSFLEGFYGTNLGADVNEAFAINSVGTPMAFAVDHDAPMLCARLAAPGSFGGDLYLGSEDQHIYRADAFGALTLFSADLGSPVESIDFGKTGLFDGYLYALLRDGRILRLLPDGIDEAFATGLLPGELAKGPARNDLRFSWEGAELFVTDVLRSCIYAIRADVEVGIDDHESIPMFTALQGNYPNPFNPKTTIRFSLAERAAVELSIYSVTGRCIRSLAFGESMDPGVHELEWDGLNERGTRAATGVYFARLIAGSETFTRKMVLLK